MRTLLPLLLVLYSFALQAQDGYQYQKPQPLADGWVVGHLGNSGLDPGKVTSAMGMQLVRTSHQIHSFLIIKNDSLVFEEYFSGYDRNTRQDLRSVTKSLIALMTGIAIDQGLFGLDDPIGQHLEEFKKAKNADPRKEMITIRHLMTMSSGMDCNDWDQKSKGQEDRIYRKKNWIQALADLPMVREPGEASSYCTGGVMLTATLIERASGMSLQDFAQKYLFDPMGITDLNWGHTNKKEVISAGQRVYMLPRDLAKFGQLLLNEGSWKGKQVVPKAWIEDINTSKTKITGLDYSFWWWQFPFNRNGQLTKGQVATGNGGQYIMAFPQYDMVVIFTGGAYNSPDDKIPFAIMNNFVLPAVK